MPILPADCTPQPKKPRSANHIIGPPGSVQPNVFPEEHSIIHGGSINIIKKEDREEGGRTWASAKKHDKI